MNKTVERDMTWSAVAFREKVWPIIEPVFTGRVEIVEGPYRSRNFLDTHAGIDAWQILDQAKSMRGIASRIQKWTDRPGYPYQTFSVRLSRPNNHTEYEKRLAAIKSDLGLLYPHLTIQAYLDADGEVLTLAVVKTKDLYGFIESKGIGSFREIVNRDKSSSFIAIRWPDLERSEVSLWIWRREIGRLQ